jgi:hypothetical protein
MRPGNDRESRNDHENGTALNVDGAGADAHGPEKGTKLDAKEAEVKRVVPSWVKGPVDAVGFLPEAGNLASVGSTGLSAIELAGQSVKGDKEGMKQAATDLAVDASSILLTRGGGLLAKGAVKGAVKLAEAGGKAGKVAKVIEKGGAMAAKGESALGKIGISRDSIKDAGKQLLQDALARPLKK